MEEKVLNDIKLCKTNGENHKYSTLKMIISLFHKKKKKLITDSSCLQSQVSFTWRVPLKTTQTFTPRLQSH